MRCSHMRRPLKVHYENYPDYTDVKTLFVVNELIWYKYKDIRLLQQGQYSLPIEKNSKENGSNFYAMLDVNRALYLTGANYADRLASPNTYF